MTEQTVERYNVGLNSIGCAVYYKNDEGRFVRFSDYDALQSRLDAAEARYDEMCLKAAFHAEREEKANQQLAERDAVLREHLENGEEEGCLPDDLYNRTRQMLSSAEPVKPTCTHGRTHYSQRDGGEHVCSNCGESQQGGTFMGEPLIQPYEAPRQQVNTLFKLLGFSGSASVGDVLDAAIARLEPAKGGDGEVVHD